MCACNRHRSLLEGGFRKGVPGVGKEGHFLLHYQNDWLHLIYFFQLQKVINQEIMKNHFINETSKNLVSVGVELQHHLVVYMLVLYLLLRYVVSRETQDLIFPLKNQIPVFKRKVFGIFFSAQKRSYLLFSCSLFPLSLLYVVYTYTNCCCLGS